MRYKVDMSQSQTLRLSETNTTASILQNIRILLSTRQGTVPLYREFGLKQQFLDKPMPVAKAMMYTEIHDAVMRFEPRAEVVGISFTEDAETPGRLIPAVEVEILE